MTSDYIVTPVDGDMLSAESILDLEDRLKNKWRTTINTQRPHALAIKSPFPTREPIFLGTIISRYAAGDIRPGLENLKTCQTTAYWIEMVEKTTNTAVKNLAGLHPPLAINPVSYENIDMSTTLARIPLDNQLMKLSQHFSTPVHYLRDCHLGKDQDGMRERVRRFDAAFTQGCYSILKLIRIHCGLDLSVFTPAKQ